MATIAFLLPSAEYSCVEADKKVRHQSEESLFFLCAVWANHWVKWLWTNLISTFQAQAFKHVWIWQIIPKYHATCFCLVYSFIATLLVGLVYGITYENAAGASVCWCPWRSACIQSSFTGLYLQSEYEEWAWFIMPESLKMLFADPLRHRRILKHAVEKHEFSGCGQNHTGEKSRI